jgi:uncharacterized membrane protein YheB (UPF0754 family)
MSALVYSIRFDDKLELSDELMKNIAKLRTTAAAYRPVRAVRPKYVARKREDEENWRAKVLVDYVRRVRETDDPEYDNIFAIFNKIAVPSLNKLSEEAIAILKTRDEKFRLRVTTLLFDRAIRGSVYAGIMADLAVKLNSVIPDVAEDLQTHIQLFTTIYDMSETLVYPSSTEAGYDDKLIAWSKQKDVRRGYARFLTHLFTRDLISGHALQESMQKVIQDLGTTVIQPKTAQTEENVTQFADFLYEIAKLLKPTAVELRGLIVSRVEGILGRPRGDVPSMNMRSRFKLEDAVKCVKVC